jgi:RHS repeat-associated protein
VLFEHGLWAANSTGKERDSESGLDDFGARYYSSAIGRFASPDWNANPTPIPYANLAYPQSLNLYSYVQNNPLTFRDPNGHCTVDGEKHNWLWCAAHSVGITETKKETAAREKNEAEVREFLRTHPQYLQNAILMAASLGTMVALEATNMGAGESNSTVSADEQTAIEAGAAGEAGAARNAANLANLEKSLASEEQVGETGGVIAGTGARVPFRDAARVAQQYGGSASDWVKVSSSSYTARDGTKFETHWVENIKTGQRVEFKTKFP